MKNIFITLVTLIGFIFSQECEEPVNVWFKISNDINSKNYGKVVSLDMSSGYAYTDGINIYLMVTDKNTKENLMVLFPIGKWVTSEPTEFEKDLEREFRDLEDYLKYNKDKGIKIERKLN